MSAHAPDRTVRLLERPVPRCFPSEPDFLEERRAERVVWEALRDQERSVVVLAVNGFKDVERAKEVLYVGLSRARTLLVVVGHREVLERVGGRGVAKRLAAERWTP